MKFQYTFYTKVGVYAGIFSFLISIIGVYFWGLTGAVWALVLTRGLQWMLNHIVLNRVMVREKIITSYRNIKNELPLLWKFSLPAILAGSVTSIFGWTANIILVNLPQGYSEMGLFSAANQWRTYLLLLPAIIGQVVLPILSERISKADLSGIKKTLITSVLVNGILTLLIGSLVALFSKSIMGLYGEDFISGWKTLIIIMLFTVLISVQTPVGQIITATGKMWLGLFMNCIWGIVLLGTFSYLKKYGAMGMAISYLLSYVIHTIWVFIFIVHYFEKRETKDDNKTFI